MLKNKFISLFLFLIVTFTTSFTGGILTIKFKDPWYSQLNKPFFNPPDWIFAPVWTILYFLMALAIWNIWIKSNKLNLVYLYFIHLIFNTTWSIVFFGFKNIELALINLYPTIFHFVKFMSFLIQVTGLGVSLTSKTRYLSVYVLTFYIVTCVMAAMPSISERRDVTMGFVFLNI